MHNYLEVDRNVAQGNKGTNSNMQETLGSLHKLATIKGCPAFTDNEASLLCAVTTQAQKATQRKALQMPNNHDKSAQNRQTLTRDEIGKMFAVCAQSPRLVGAQAQALIQLGLQTGLRGCELIHANGMTCKCKKQTSSVTLSLTFSKRLALASIKADKQTWGHELDRLCTACICSL